jgi:hypothetical protein
MGICFSIDGKYPMVKAYCRNLYPGLNESTFDTDPLALKDDGGYYEMRSTQPTVELSNASAHTMLDIMGYKPEACGVIPLSKLSHARQALMRTINADSRTERLYTRPSSMSVGQNGTTFIDCGTDVQDIKCVCESLMALFLQAQEAGLCVYWA